MDFLIFVVLIFVFVLLAVYDNYINTQAINKGYKNLERKKLLQMLKNNDYEGPAYIGGGPMTSEQLKELLDPDYIDLLEFEANYSVAPDYWI